MKASSVPLLVLAAVVATVVMVLSLAASAESCVAVCGRDYNPVCGDHQGTQKTFSNKCMMDYYNCLKGTDFVVVLLDECPGELPTDLH